MALWDGGDAVADDVADVDDHAGCVRHDNPCRARSIRLPAQQVFARFYAFDIELIAAGFEAVGGADPAV